MTDLEALVLASALTACGVVGMFVAGPAYASVMYLWAVMLLMFHILLTDHRRFL